MNSLAALRYRNFRLLWIGLLVSFTGSMMQNAAVLWQVSLLVAPEHKGLALGVVGLVRVGPIVLLSLVSGVVADVLNRRMLMMVANLVAAIVSLALAILTLRGLFVVWPVYAVTAVGSAVSAFDLPARQALLPMLVSREDLPNALSLNATMMQVASVAGPALTGVLIATTGGVGAIYVVNAISFFFVIGALLAMRDVPEREAATTGKKDEVSLAAALEGLRFVFSAPLIRSTMLLDFFATFFSSAMALLPIFAQDILHVGAQGYGWLYAAPAAGALVMSVFMVPLTERIERRGKVLLWAVIAYGVATVVFGLSRSFWLTFACLAATGATDTVSMVIRNIVRQLETPDRLRGRMSGVNMVFFMGGPQLGEFEAGAVANWFGAPLSVITGGVGCVAATVWIALTTPTLRHYRK